ncbi:hypothetical protein ULG90_05700 [Halopseudomonas pachastrellae]|nr:hypothetical protein ULG90_05700 [Halopseudomonas pachastrellae]
MRKPSNWRASLATCAVVSLQGSYLKKAFSVSSALASAVMLSGLGALGSAAVQANDTVGEAVKPAIQSPLASHAAD